MLQCVLTGKAQEAYAALTSEVCKNYVKVKAAVLKAYELVLEAYRQRFRNWRKSDRQTHVEFAQDLVVQFSRWCSASNVESFEELCNLVVLEQFKQSVYCYIYINECKAKTPNDVAVLADEYVLTHKRIFGDQKQSDFGPKASVDKSHSGWDLDFSKQNTDSYMKNDSL